MRKYCFWKNHIRQCLYHQLPGVEVPNNFLALLTIIIQIIETNFFLQYERDAKGKPITLFHIITQWDNKTYHQHFAITNIEPNLRLSRMTVLSSNYHIQFLEGMLHKICCSICEAARGKSSILRYSHLRMAVEKSVLIRDIFADNSIEI